MQNVEKIGIVESKKELPKINLNAVVPWFLPLSVIVAWQSVVSFGLLQTSVSPISIIQDAIKLIQNGQLQTNIGISLYRATFGLLIGGAVGLLFGFMNGLIQSASALFDTSIQMLRNIPHLSLIPLIIIMFGIGEPAKISLVAIGVMFPIYINTFQGIRSVDPKLIEMARSYGLSRWQLIRKVILPGALPNILMGLRYALGVMWTTLIVFETISSSSGIGYMANNAQTYMDITTVVLCIIIYALLGKLSDLIVKLMESIMLQWRAPQGGK